MNNFGGKIVVANQWQIAIAANAGRMAATVQNTAFEFPGYDREGIHDGPHLEVWPFPTVPTAADGPATGALLCRRAGDALRFTGADSQAAIYVRGPRGSASFAATET